MGRSLYNLDECGFLITSEVKDRCLEIIRGDDDFDEGGFFVKAASHNTSATRNEIATACSLAADNSALYAHYWAYVDPKEEAIHLQEVKNKALAAWRSSLTRAGRVKKGVPCGECKSSIGSVIFASRITTFPTNVLTLSQLLGGARCLVCGTTGIYVPSTTEAKLIEKWDKKIAAAQAKYDMAVAQAKGSPIPKTFITIVSNHY